MIIYNQTLKQILGYLDNKRTNRGEISLDEIQRLIYNKSDDILDISETTMWDGCLKMLKSLSSELGTTLKRIEHDNRMDKSKYNGYKNIFIFIIPVQD